MAYDAGGTGTGRRVGTAHARARREPAGPDCYCRRSRLTGARVGGGLRSPSPKSCRVAWSWSERGQPSACAVQRWSRLPRKRAAGPLSRPAPMAPRCCGSATPDAAPRGALAAAVRSGPRIVPCFRDQARLRRHDPRSGRQPLSLSTPFRHGLAPRHAVRGQGSRRLAWRSRLREGRVQLVGGARLRRCRR